MLYDLTQNSISHQVRGNGYTSSPLGNFCSCVLWTSLNHLSLKPVLLAVRFPCWELGRKILMITEIYSCYYWPWLVYFGHPRLLFLTLFFFSFWVKTWECAWKNRSPRRVENAHLLSNSVHCVGNVILS